MEVWVIEQVPQGSRQEERRWPEAHPLHTLVLVEGSHVQHHEQATGIFK